MFDSLADLSGKLAATGYFIDPVMIQVVFLAAKLQKPLLLEGPAGSGKTQLALSVAAAANTHVERLQCYRGVTEEKAIGQFDEGLQRLYIEFSKGQHESWQAPAGSTLGKRTRGFFTPALFRHLALLWRMAWWIRPAAVCGSPRAPDRRMQYAVSSGAEWLGCHSACR